MSRWQTEGELSWARIQASVSMVKECIDSIRDGVNKRKWDEIASSYSIILDEIESLNNDADRTSSDFVLVPQIEDFQIPAQLATIYPQEKAKLDSLLQEELAGGKTGSDVLSEEMYTQWKNRMDALNAWSDELEKTFKEYSHQNSREKRK